jgi:tripartite-type tricarboxylate transporter receptor subunit TctC
VIAPKGLPQPVLDKLMAASRAIVESDEFRNFLRLNGYAYDPKFGDDMKKELADYDGKFRAIIKFLDDDK